MLDAIHHVQITVPAAQLDEVMRFYRDALGVPLAPRPSDMGRDGYWFRVFDRDLHVGIEEDVDRAKTRAHIGYKVGDLATMRAKLQSLGIAIKTPVPLQGYERLQFRDPAGNMVELIQPTAFAMDVDRPPQPKVHLSAALLHGGKLLMVREGKASMRDKWNLPGGHAERGEFVVPGAMRELIEETGVTGTPDGILGLFSTNYSIRVVVLSHADDPQPIAGDEVLESRFWSIDDLLALDDSAFINPTMMRTILGRLKRGERYPLEVVAEIRG